MKITSGGIDYYQKVQTLKNESTSGGKGKAGGAAGKGKSDKVTISQEASNRAEASRVASAMSPEVDGAVTAEKLAALQASVADGTYHVAAEDLADAILARIS